MGLLRLGAFGLAVLFTLRRCGRPRFGAGQQAAAPVDRSARQA